VTTVGYFDTLAKFLGMFPNFLESVAFWSPVRDKNTIRVELKSGQKLLFTYWNDREWSLTAVNGAVRKV